jgi:hypothetical protein
MSYSAFEISHILHIMKERTITPVNLFAVFFLHQRQQTWFLDRQDNFIMTDQLTAVYQNLAI